MHLFLSLSKTTQFSLAYLFHPFNIPPTTQLQPNTNINKTLLSKKRKKNSLEEERTSTIISMEVALELELELDDDVFFADITKQINLLITDEDEHNPVSLSSSLSFQGLYRGNYEASRTPYMMYQDQSYNNIREGSKGTGVFIPSCSQPRKKHQQIKKQVRFGSLNPNYKQHFPHHVNDNNTTTTTPLASYNNNGQSLINLHDFPNTRRSYRDAASIFT